VVASAAFHEFGHAAGLRYGGGKVRGMGVGLYLIYPVVYTDVTDEYRLGRWGKVRTDLGGFYFNLIFASAVFAVYALTGQPFLLVSVLLTDLEIVQQLMPFTRLDGYWILADLTGIPDFFSMLIPFVRTELHLSGPHVPPLKLWARVVFAVYILVTGPLLALLLFLMVKSVPRVLATAWVSFSHQVHTFTSAQSTGNVPGMVLAVVAVIGLAIPTVGLFLVLYRFAKQGGGALWRWSAGSLPRRAVASAVSLGVSAGVIFLWLPQIPWSTNHGLLYSPAALRPIGPSERGTIHDAVPFLPGPAQGHVTRQRTSTSRTPQSKPPGTPRTAGGSQHGTTGSATGTPLPAVSTPGAPGAGTTTPTKGGASTPGAAPGRNSTPTPTSGGTRPPTPNPTTAPATSATSAPTEAPTEGSTQEQPTPTPVPQEQATPAATQGTQGQSSEQPTPTPAVPSTQGSQEEPTLEPQGTSSQSTQNASPSTSTDGQTSPTSSPAPPPPGATSQSNQLPSDQTTQGTTVGPAATTAGP
jgi:putative peptide zinc metalloprotease protein